MGNILDNTCREYQNTFIFNNLLPKIMSFTKYCGKTKVLLDRPQITILITAQELCILDNLGYRRAPIKCNTYCFYVVTMVT
jgi:hypothetical protein